MRQSDMTRLNDRRRAESGFNDRGSWKSDEHQASSYRLWRQSTGLGGRRNLESGPDAHYDLSSWNSDEHKSGVRVYQAKLTRDSFGTRPDNHGRNESEYSEWMNQTLPNHKLPNERCPNESYDSENGKPGGTLHINDTSKSLECSPYMGIEIPVKSEFSTGRERRMNVGPRSSFRGNDRLQQVTPSASEHDSMNTTTDESNSDFGTITDTLDTSLYDGSMSTSLSDPHSVSGEFSFYQDDDTSLSRQSTRDSLMF